MSVILSDSEEANSGWNTKNHYFYEIRNNEQKEICDKINEYFPARQQKANWQWRTPFSTKQVKIDEELSEDKIFEQLNKRLEDIKAFEVKLKGLLG